MTSNRFIFITGGVVSGLGKGICAASIGMLLQTYGFKIRLRKLDPYLNIDPGTMNPLEHGEVFVTEDGLETDLDLGHYERFTGITTKKSDIVTTGKIYHQVLNEEREGHYLGRTVQIVPHITDAIKNFILADLNDEDFIICEIGGTVGDIEGLPLLEAIRQLRNDLGRERVMFVHLTLVPYLLQADALKTKPTQHSVKALLNTGIQADMLICRATRVLNIEIMQKLAVSCNLRLECIKSAPDIANLYENPLIYHAQQIPEVIFNFFNLEIKEQIDLSNWQKICLLGDFAVGIQTIKIGVVAKYVGLKDAYKSLTEALIHAANANNVKVEIMFIDSRDEASLIGKIQECQGIVIAGGFGASGINGKLKAIAWARTHNLPTLGICLGFQLMLVEAVRALGYTEAYSREFDEHCLPVVTPMQEWTDNTGLVSYKQDSLGGSMRLGAYDCIITAGTKAATIYNTTLIFERHRHRFEANMAYEHLFKQADMLISGKSKYAHLPEIAEHLKHPWFVGVQFHPEFTSTPLKPNPIFVALIAATRKEKAETN